MEELKEMQKVLADIAADMESFSKQSKDKSESKPKVQKRVQKEKAEKPDKAAHLESVIRTECAEIKRMIGRIDNQIIADSVSRMVVNQIVSPLQEAMRAALKEPEKSHSIGRIAEDMKRKVERLSDRHVKVISCLSRAKGEWIDYDSLASACGISKSCMRGYISDLKRVYEIPLESSRRNGKSYLRLDPKTVNKLALGYQAVRIEAK